jgi:peptidoglycan/LPS O-acetylase OafA/YrhL
MKLTYRPEIDGLRAIAVVAVILYHAQITIFGHQLFKGGFVGVDIFFVISGYLITSIILKELVTTGSFSFKHFYERRVRRILPALLFVMLVSLPFAWIYLLPSSFVDFSKSILYSLGFSSNFYFHYSDQEYGAVSGLFKPFLHTWSLSVEEQFYILFPIILSIIFKYFKKYIIHTLILGFFIGLALADWNSKNYPSVSFYFLHTRMWELLAGSVLAYYEIKQGYRSKNKILNLILPTIGLLLIIFYIFFFKLHFPHPSLHTLPLIIGICLMIWFSNKGEIITKILSTKLIVGVGLISYSLYLWHYPIYAFAKVTYFFEYNIVKQLFSGLVILVASIISYYFIEKPFRNKKYNFKVLFSVILITVFVLGITNLNTIFKDGYKNRVPEILSKNLSEAHWSNLKNSDGKTCHYSIDGCKYNTNSNKKVFINGDSHMATLTFDLKNKIVKNNYQFITSTGCLYFPGFNKVDVKTKKIDELCNDNIQKLKKNLSKEKNSIIIFGGRFPLILSNYYFDNQEGGAEIGPKRSKYISLGRYNTIQNSFKNEILELSNNNKIILIYPIPEVGWNPVSRIFFDRNNKLSTKSNIKDFITTSYKVYKERTKSSFELLDSIKGDNIYRVYPHTLFCDTTIKNRCVTHDDKNMFYADDDHLSSKGAEMTNDLIMKEIEKIEVKSN